MERLLRRVNVSVWTRNLVLFAVAVFLARLGQGLQNVVRINFFVDRFGLSGGQVLWLEGIRELPGLGLMFVAALTMRLALRWQGALALLLMVRIAKTTEDERHTTNNKLRFTNHVSRFILLGTVVGLAILTKESAGGLIVLTALTVAYVAWRERSPRTLILGGLTTGGPTLIVAGWWYLRNWRLYGDFDL